MKARGVALFVVATVWLGGCASIIGLNDLEEVDCVGPSCIDAGDASKPDVTVDADAGEETDTSVSEDGALDANETSVVDADDAEAADDATDAGEDATDAADDASDGALDTALDTAPTCEAGPSACGSCTRACSTTNVATAICKDGLCESTCAPGYGNCTTPAAPAADDGCETKLDSLTNCGACGSACDTTNSLGAACDGTKCTYTGCKPGFFDCDTTGTNANGCETPAGAICGSCSTSCDVTNSVGASCTSGTKCTYTGCKSGFANCKTSGVDLDGCETSTKTISDCGGCGNACDTTNSVGAACTGTTCVYTSCKAGFGNCSSTEPDLDGCETPLTTTANCGGCGIKCTLTNASSASCDGTKCSYTCSSGSLDCNAGIAPNADGCESSRSSVNTCGSCGAKCDTATGTPSCDGTKCSYACGAGRLDCNAATAPNTDGCESIATSVDTCGSCGAKCDTTTGTPACDGTKCSYACAAGRLDCDSTIAPNTNGCETSSSSTLNCGGCGNKCTLTNASSTSCDGSKCSYTCSSGYGDCNAAIAPNVDGCETALTSPTNCGACGRTCDTTTSVGAACPSGTCTYTGCASGFANCDTASPDTNGCETPVSSSIVNCGGCARSCSTTGVSGTPVCSGGKCTSSCTTGRSNCNQPSAPLADDGCECATPVCCGTGCGVTHKNCASGACGGLGQDYWLSSDGCKAQGVPGNASTYTAEMANAARDAWPVSGTHLSGTCGTGNNAVCKEGATSGAVWVYSGTLAGYVRYNTTKCAGSYCCCPTTSDATWN